MKARAASIGIVLLAVGILVSAGVSKAMAEEANTHEGHVVSAGSGRLSMMGTDGKQQSFDIGDMVKVTINGHTGRLEDLKTGARIRVTTDKSGRALNVATVDSTKGSFDSVCTD